MQTFQGQRAIDSYRPICDIRLTDGDVAKLPATLERTRPPSLGDSKRELAAHLTRHEGAHGIPGSVEREAAVDLGCHASLLEDLGQCGQRFGPHDARELGVTSKRLSSGSGVRV